jgi:hypothetical protein
MKTIRPPNRGVLNSSCLFILGKLRSELFVRCPKALQRSWR